MISYTWLITNLELQKQDQSLLNIVITINWVLTGSDGDYRSREFGTTKLASPDPNNFIDFHNLTNETLVGWIVGTVDVEELKQKLAEEIAEMQDEPTVFVNFPGAAQTPVTTLEQLKHNAKHMLNASYNGELMIGITSTVLGQPHKYRYLPTEQSCLQLAAQFGGLLYCSLDDVWAYKPHTPAQANDVLTAMWQQIQTLQQKLQMLSNSVDAAASEQEVNAVVW